MSLDRSNAMFYNTLTAIPSIGNRVFFTDVPKDNQNALKAGVSVVVVSVDPEVEGDFSSPRILRWTYIMDVRHLAQGGDSQVAVARAFDSIHAALANTGRLSAFDMLGAFIDELRDKCEYYRYRVSATLTRA